MINPFERSVLNDYFLEHGYQSQGYFQARVGLQITGKYANIYANADVNTYANTDTYADVNTYAYASANADAYTSEGAEMSTVKALAEVLAEHVKEHISADDLLERLQDIIAVESAGERLVTNEAGRAAERAQQAPMAATRAQVLTEAEQVARSVGQLHEEHQQELKRLFEAQQRRELHLQLESDRRARSVAEAIIERVVQIGITERKAIEDINIEAIVDGSKQS